MANNRILVNPTRVPKSPNIEDAEVTSEIKAASMQQGELSFQTLEKYIRDLHYFFIKQHNVAIPLMHIYTIMKVIYDDGRLAISPQKMRRMGIDFPTLNLKESSSYSNHYNNWKKHIKSGVKI